MTRLLEQVGGHLATERRIMLIPYSKASAFEKAGNNPLSSYSFIIKCTTRSHHLNADFGQPTSIENANSIGIRRTPCATGTQSFLESGSVKRLSDAER
jgi:hypothetical protein